MESFSLEHFDDFLSIARQESTSQRLILVLAHRELPSGHTTEQARRFEAGYGGHLAPVACVDKTLDELTSFRVLLEESVQVVNHWDAVFVTTLVGSGNHLPTREVTEKAIDRALRAVRSGIVSDFLVFDRNGEPLNLTVG